MANSKRLLWAGFMAILAAGVGMAIRGGILGDWKGEFGFTDGQLGDLNGAGFTGFCFGIIIGGIIADKIGYGKLVIAAFLLHVLSAFVTFAANKGMDQGTAYKCIYWGTWIFALANGTLEAVANPLVATLFPQNRTHYLNILHASWPLGLMVGSVLGAILGNAMHLHWKIQLGMFLVPTAVYGLMFFGQVMPKSEASEKGLSLGDMFKDVGVAGGLIACFLLAMFFEKVLGNFISARGAMAVGYIIGGLLLVGVGVITRFSVGSMLLFFLFIAHALVGAVELGTDGWIQNITGNLLSGFQGKMLFFWTSSVMFGLRFCAHFIEKKMGLSPVGILLVCAVLACVGLVLSSGVTSFGVAVLALGVYALGKTFFWPTMLAVASDRFPRTGAIAISFMGGIGMMSAGLIGSAGLGYAKDRFASDELQRVDTATYSSIKAKDSTKFLFFREVTGFDGIKVDTVKKHLDTARDESAKAGKDDLESALQRLTPSDRHVIEAGIVGDRKTLRADAFIPAIMAVIYLAVMLYFKTIGGYKPVTISSDAAPKASPTGPPS